MAWADEGIIWKSENLRVNTVMERKGVAQSVLPQPRIRRVSPVKANVAVWVINTCHTAISVAWSCANLQGKVAERHLVPELHVDVCLGTRRLGDDGLHMWAVLSDRTAGSHMVCMAVPRSGKKLPAEFQRELSNSSVHVSLSAVRVQHVLQVQTQLCDGL